MTEFIYGVGDRVRYTGKDRSVSSPHLVGELGTVTEASQWDVSVKFDNGTRLTALPTNVELVERAISEQVDHPPHYTWLGGIEVIDITEQLSFTLGNVIKYVLRADHKGKPIEDLEKAQWYLAREIKRRKGEQK